MQLLCTLVIVCFFFVCESSDVVTQKVGEINKDKFYLANVSDQDEQETGNLPTLGSRDFRNDLDIIGGYSEELKGSTVYRDKGITYADIIGENDNYNDQENFGRYGYQKGNDKSFDGRTVRRLDKIFGFTGPTANDEPENLIRPCALDDWQCIRKYFAANSQCTPAHGPTPDPFLIEKNTVFFSAVNVIGNFINLSIRGLSSAKVNDFYVKKKSGNLVFAIDVQNLNISSPRGYLRYRRTAKESIVLADTAFVNFRTATLTAVLSKVPKLQLDNADIHFYTDDGFPEFAFGPGIYNSTDPNVIAANTQFAVSLPISVREGLVFLAPLITGIYIQNNICDFGIKLISL